MQQSDLFFVLQWWGYLFLIGLIFLPVAAHFFTAFFDKGYVFAKTIGLAIFSYVVLLLGIMHLPILLRPSLCILLIFLCLLTYGVTFAKRKIIFGPKKYLMVLLRQHWKVFLFEEIFFLFGVFLLAFIRSFQPDIHGLEKFMDYGIINSILRSPSLPPKDMWLTPYTINYYYFGHLVTALLTRLTGIPANISFNLMLATIFSLCLTSSFSIGANLIANTHSRLTTLKRLVVGMLTACLLTFGGNLHTLYTFLTPYQNDHPVPPWELTFSPQTFPNAYWYPNATRFIYNTIHEFPMYSWTVSDLHGHVLDIPFVLLTIALLFAFYLRLQDNTETPGESFQSVVNYWKKELNSLTCISFLLGIMYMTNAWDGIIYFLLTILVIFFISFKRIWHFHAPFMDKLYTVITDILIPTIFVFAGFIIWSMPFSFFFKPFVSGIGVLCAPKFLTSIGHIGPLLFEVNHCQHSPWWQLLILYGFFYFFVLSFLIFLYRRKDERKSDGFIILLIMLSTLLIIIPEFIYVKDIYPQHYRANTMFKLVFQAFMLLSLVSAYSVYRILSSIRLPHIYQSSRIFFSRLGFFIWAIIAIVFFIPVSIYPHFAIMSYYNNLSQYVGLDGTHYLKTLYPSDYTGIQWLNKNITGQPVILEAQGDSYTDYARISANTGLPTILGWTVHEWLWRGSYDTVNPVHNPNTIYDVPAPRISEVQTLYESKDLTETKRLLKKYNVKLVFIGTLEYQKYPNIDEAKFQQLGSLIFHDGTTKIYQIKKI